MYLSNHLSSLCLSLKLCLKDTNNNKTSSPIHDSLPSTDFKLQDAGELSMSWVTEFLAVHAAVWMMISKFLRLFIDLLRDVLHVYTDTYEPRPTTIASVIGQVALSDESLRYLSFSFPAING
jgi:hypothetical protein